MLVGSKIEKGDSMKGMVVPSGRRITGEDVLYIIAKVKAQGKQGKHKSNHHLKPKQHCWYCSNGHHRELLTQNTMQYYLCECGATDVVMLKRGKVKQHINAKLGREAMAAWLSTTDQNKLKAAKTKAMV